MKRSMFINSIREGDLQHGRVFWCLVSFLAYVFTYRLREHRVSSFLCRSAWANPSEGYTASEERYAGNHVM